ncbi:metallophosphoesterase [Rhizobium sp. Rhizsp82]|uniref:metallophosphoesterase n=1 Tax=Rhizobium sp. Rhizsp82 TaxID=3243057 RepID=UPI0039B4D0AE
MKAWIISDIHSSRLDLLHRRPLIIPRADICICAGDISDNVERSIDFLHNEIAPHMPVVLTLGNHDYYGSSIDSALEYARKWTAGTNVHLLENSTFEKNDLRVIGSTLWTDFEIVDHEYGHLPVDERRRLAIQESMRYLLDFRLIHRVDPLLGVDSLLEPDEMIIRHWDSRAFIDGELGKPFTGTSMVLTHHAISRRSLDPRFAGQVTNAAFASDLTEIIRRRKPHFWIHGHIHRHADYVEGDTRVLCNPRGYLHEGSNGFRPGFVIETSVADTEERSDG